MTFQELSDIQPTLGSLTPWGRSDTATVLAPGIVRVITPSHGGIWVAPERRHEIRPDWLAYGAQWSHGWGEGWFEEDVAACAVIATLPEVAPYANTSREDAEAAINRYINPVRSTISWSA
jgi:hypothetical protein